MSTFFRAICTMFNTNTSLRSQHALWFEDSSNLITAAQVAGFIDTNWWGNAPGNGLRLISSFHVKMESYSVQKFSPPPPAAAIPLPANQGTGAIGSGVAYPTVGLVFTTLDGGSGRRHHGRVYHSATALTSLGNSVPTPAVVASFASVRDGWLNSFGPLPTTGLHWCIYHRDLSGDARWTRITDVRIAAFCGNQRRRNFNVGL